MLATVQTTEWMNTQKEEQDATDSGDGSRTDSSGGDEDFRVYKAP